MSSNPYSRSNMPPARSTTGPAANAQPINLNSGKTLYDTSRAQQAARSKGPILPPDRQRVSYPSMVKYELLVIPRPESDLRLGNFDEVLANDLGRHITSRVKEGFSVSPGEAVNTLNHYVGCTKGLQLFDKSSQAGFEAQASHFTANPTEESLKGIEQYLNSLTPELQGAE